MPMVLKAFPDLKQSTRLWYNTCVNKMKERWFFESYYDHAPYLDYNHTYIACYVYDFQIVGPDLIYL